MAWGSEAKRTLFRLYDQGQSESEIVKSLNNEFGVNDKTIRRCLAGLDLLKAEEEGRKLDSSRFEALGGTQHYLQGIRRPYTAYREPVVNRGDHKDLREWITENFDKAVIAKEALRHHIRTRLQVAFSEGFIGVIMPTHDYGPLERDIIRSIEQRDPRLQNSLSDLDAALRGKDRSGAEQAADEVSRLLDDWITL